MPVCILLATSLPQSEHAAYSEILDGHLSSPQSAQLVQVLSRLGILDVTANSVVSSANPALDLELDVGLKSTFRAANEGMVTKLVLHLAKENTSSVHVRLGDETGECC